MSAGFNTDIRIGEQVFHVQTEDRGPAHLVIDTAVYQHGQLLYRRSSLYEAFRDLGRGLSTSSAENDRDASRERAEKQHRIVIDELRAGALNEEIASAIENAKKAGGIQVQLLNANSWLSAGKVSLKVEVLRRADKMPQAGARVEAAIEGASESSLHAGTSDDQGHVLIQFPLPPLGNGNLALVIQATADAGKDEIRFAMRSRPKAPSDAAQGS